MTNDGRRPRAQRALRHLPSRPSTPTGRSTTSAPRASSTATAVFDVPHLTNIYDSAPYLHNGDRPSLEEIWTGFNPYDQHGVTNDMTKDQLNDLIEYLKTL